jgi:hypothetical protein
MPSSRSAYGGASALAARPRYDRGAGGRNGCGGRFMVRGRHGPGMGDHLPESQSGLAIEPRGESAMSIEVAEVGQVAEVARSRLRAGRVSTCASGVPSRCPPSPSRGGSRRALCSARPCRLHARIRLLRAATLVLASAAGRQSRQARARQKPAREKNAGGTRLPGVGLEELPS